MIIPFSTSLTFPFTINSKTEPYPVAETLFIVAQAQDILLYFKIMYNESDVNY